MSGIDVRGPFDDMMERVPDMPGITYTVGTVGGVPGMWCRPEAAPADAAILYPHGGAYVVGSAKAYRHFVAQIAARCGVAAFVVDYRLAPENVFPAAIDDARAAYRELITQGARIAIVGDSAGGGGGHGACFSVERRDARSIRGSRRDDVCISQREFNGKSPMTDQGRVR